MKALFVSIFLAMLLLGCTTNVNVKYNSTKNTTIPAGYEIKDYCKKDSDCVRLNKCCDCGAGEYVNIYHQVEPLCEGPRCLCAIMDSKGECQNNKCVAVPIAPEPPEPEKNTSEFCGYSTNGACNSTNDCIVGGCSSQVCQSKSEDSVITTCEYRTCYDSRTFGLNCGCVNNKCQWS